MKKYASALGSIVDTLALEKEHGDPDALKLALEAGFHERELLTVLRIVEAARAYAWAMHDADSDMSGQEAILDFARMIEEELPPAVEYKPKPGDIVQVTMIGEVFLEDDGTLIVGAAEEDIDITDYEGMDITPVIRS